MDSKNFGFETLQIHAGQKPDATTKATGLPLYLSNAFTFDDANQALPFLFEGHQQLDLINVNKNILLLLMQKF